MQAEATAAGSEFDDDEAGAIGVPAAVEAAIGFLSQFNDARAADVMVDGGQVLAAQSASRLVRAFFSGEADRAESAWNVQNEGAEGV